MNLETFAREVENALQRVDTLQERMQSKTPVKKELLSEAVTELQTVIEELRVADEELRTQNDQLAAARELLEAERQRYIDLFEFAPDAYLVTDLYGTIQEVNRAATALLNLPSGMLTGKPLVTFIPASERSAFRSHLRQLSQQDSVAEWEIRLHPRQGQALHTSARVGVIRDWKGERVGLRWILRDISAYMATVESLLAMHTEAQEEPTGREAELQTALGQARYALTEEHRARLQAEAAQHDLRLLVNVSSTLLKSLDSKTLLKELTDLCVPYLADWCTLDSMDAGHLVRIASAHRDPAQAQIVADLLDSYPPESHTLMPLLRVLKTGETEWLPVVPEASDLSDPSERVYLTALKALGFASCVVLPLRADDEPLGVLTLVRGVNSPLYLERERVLLETIAGYVACALQNANRYQQAQQEIRNHCLAEEEMLYHRERLTVKNIHLQRMMVETHHRVKNNLQILASLIEVQITNDVPAPLRIAYQRLLLHIRALATLHELLTVSSQKEQSVQTIPTEEMFNVLMETLSQMAGASNLTYTVQDTQVTPQQGTALAILVGELVSNALKHGNGTVAINFRVEKKQGILEVTDDGPGFPDDFTPAQASHTGLELIESLTRFDLGGAVSYENQPQGGAVVRAVFPLGQTKSPPSPR